jgi:hypothetical protein
VRKDRLDELYAIILENGFRRRPGSSIFHVLVKEEDPDRFAGRFGRSRT